MDGPRPGDVNGRTFARRVDESRRRDLFDCREIWAVRRRRGIWSESGPVLWRRHLASRWPPTPIASKTETVSLPGNYVTVTFLDLSNENPHNPGNAARREPAAFSVLALAVVFDFGVGRVRLHGADKRAAGRAFGNSGVLTLPNCAGLAPVAVPALSLAGRHRFPPDAPRRLRPCRWCRRTWL